MKRAGLIVSMILFSLAVLLAPNFSLSAVGDCPRFPNVSWWKNNTHESVIKEILEKYHGDWTSYLASFETQLDRMQEIQKQGKTAYISEGASNILVKNLPAYITKLEKRLAVIHCLRENQAATSSSAMVIPRKGDPKKGETLSRTAGCFGCHGVFGISKKPDAPNLAGQNDLYLIKQLKEFLVEHGRSDTSKVMGRHSEIMDAKVKKFSDRDIWDLVAFYSDLSCKLAGQRPSDKIPAPRKSVLCVECHGNNGNSVYKEIPNLAGQSERYLFNQLKAFRISSMGKSRSTDSDQRFHLFMSQQVSRLTNADISALAKYYNGLTCR